MVGGGGRFFISYIPFRLTILIHLLLLHSPTGPCPFPSTQPGPAFVTVFGALLLLSTSPTRSVTHLSPSTSTSTPCTILSSTHSRLPRSKTHFLSPHSQPLGAHTSSKNLVPFDLSPAILCGDNGSYGFGLKIQDSHSPVRPPFRFWSSKTSTSRVSGGASRMISRVIQESRSDWAFRS